MKIAKGLDKGKWYDWRDGVSVCIKMYPWSKMAQLTTIADLEATHKVFMECVVNWKGFEWQDEENTTIECNEDNKQYIYDYYSDFGSFVVKKVSEDFNRTKTNSKNLKSSQSGTRKKKTSAKDAEKPVLN